ncbi:MAG: Gfo/Idh/MocA family oxidoreductase [Alphaproteobacteria bacterium]|nr:Gfo/Idh/MocA family oxidoreductase [Alphaproteobacteria bacterium]
MPETHTVAVLGLGSIGQRHARNLAALGARVTGYDPDRAAGADIAERRETRAAALEDADAVIVASPSKAHLDDLEAALDAGCHVLVEKPLGHDRARAAALVERAEREGRIVVVGHNLRFHPAVSRLRSLLADRTIGNPIWLRALAASHLPDWRPGRDHRTGYAADPQAGGVIMDFTHEIDLAVHLLGPGELVTAAAANTGRVGLPTEDMADLVVAHATGARSNIHVDYLTRPAQRMVEVAGDDGFARADLIARTLDVHAVDGSVIRKERFDGSFDDDYIAEARHFLDCLNGADPVSPARDGLVPLEIALAARVKGVQ